MKNALKLDPLSHVLHSSLASIYWHSGQRDPSFEHRKRALELAPGFISALTEQAECYLAIDQVLRADQKISEILDIDPENQKAISLRQRT